MLSVITPVLNSVDYVENCIRNVIGQSCNSVEHIIVDGGSSDNTVEVIYSYASQYNHIRWISEQDRGQSDALNKGIAIARGRILGILNVDDAYEPGTLNRVLSLFKDLETPAFLVGNCNILGEDDKLLAINKPRRLGLKDLLVGPRVNPFPINPSAYFYHASLHDLIGGYDVEDHFTMDWEFILRAVQVAHVKYVDVVFGNYRLIPGTKTFEDLQSGMNIQRAEKLLAKYRSRLSLQDRLLVSLCAWLCDNSVISTAQYFINNPAEFPERLKARLYKAIGWQ